MLVNVTCALRQYSRSATAAFYSATPSRALATSSILRQEASRPIPFRHSARSFDRPKDGTGKAGEQWGAVFSLAHTSKKTRMQTPEDTWETFENSVQLLPKPHNAYSGRSMPVYHGDVGAALAKLHTVLQKNAVRATNVRDERHEKKGEKRNRLRSIRWRKRFAHEVRKRVQLVNEIRARGA